MRYLYRERCCPLRNTSYHKSCTRAVAIVIMAEGKLDVKKLTQGCTCAPGNIPSRGPWALLSEFHKINATYISVTRSLQCCAPSREALTSLTPEMSTLMRSVSVITFADLLVWNIVLTFHVASYNCFLWRTTDSCWRTGLACFTRAPAPLLTAAFP